jgi:hypothetical protein
VHLTPTDTTQSNQYLPPNVTKKGGWKPERKGELADGKLVDVNDGEGGFGPYKIYVLEQDGGEEIAVHAFHDMLVSEFAKWQPQWGEHVRILYRGRGGDGGDSQTDPYLYRMGVDGREPPPITYDAPLGPNGPEGGQPHGSPYRPQSDVPAPDVTVEGGDDHGSDVPF